MIDRCDCGYKPPWWPDLLVFLMMAAALAAGFYWGQHFPT